ncbi:hypothetical protein MMC22_009564 [Lobaria immixta]|nr:hypothetical protein [Lobaria immixta]
MSRLFPHPAYAEDQPLFRTILGTHVLHRGFQTGALIGLLAGATRPLLPRKQPPTTTTTKAGLTSGLKPLLLRPLLERSTGLGAVIGTGLLAIGLGARMYGREEIEWRDRSWRLLENKGQMLVDDLSIAGMVLGGRASVALMRRNGEKLAWRRVVGGAGIGSVAGILAYLGWTYGVRRDKD